MMVVFPEPEPPEKPTIIGFFIRLPEAFNETLIEHTTDFYHVDSKTETSNYHAKTRVPKKNLVGDLEFPANLCKKEKNSDYFQKFVQRRHIKG